MFLISIVLFASLLLNLSPCRANGGAPAGVALMATDISLTKSVFSQGEQVQAVIRSPAQVLVGSDLLRSSRQFDIFGTKTVDLGAITTDTYCVITTDDGSNKAALQILFLRQGSNFEAITTLVPLARNDAGPTAQIGPAIEKFLRNINASRVGRAYASAKAKFPSENAVALGNTVIICLITIPTGTWLACAATVGGVAVDFMFKLNEELIDVMGPTKDRVLTEAEANLLKTWAGAAKVVPDAAKLIFSSDKVEKVFSALKVGTGAGEVVIDNADGKFIFKTAGDFFKKYEVIFKLNR